jgi:hypothetical protein
MTSEKGHELSQDEIRKQFIAYILGVVDYMTIISSRARLQKRSGRPILFQAQAR